IAAATRIETPPQSTTAKKGETVTFRCGAAFDPDLAPRGIEWRRDGHLLRETADSDKYGRSGG
ncbi:L1CAM protein, partial [Crypturellus undulatus]|nr:L1CAM protein [Crypturellus undulatus]